MKKGNVLALFIIGALLTCPLSAHAAETVLRGDLNHNGIVNTADAVIVLQAAAKYGVSGDYGLTAEEQLQADVNRDSLINSKDARDILRYSAYAGTTVSTASFDDYMTEINALSEPVIRKVNFLCNDNICKAYWLDMSKAADYVFEGEFFSFTFRVKDDIPDGHYPVSISKTDIASWEEVWYNPEIINGEVAVGTTPEAQPEMPENDFAMKVNSVAAKQGDTVTVTVDVANNPGFCGFVIDLQYDSSALELTKAGSGADYRKAVDK